MATPDIIAPWHPVTNPECTNCKGLARPVRPKRKPSDCGLVQIKLSRKAALRRQLLSIVKRSEIPKDLLARCILGKSTPQLWRDIKHGIMSSVTADQINAMEYIRREGSKVYVVYDVGSLGPRWDATLKRRKRAETIASCAMTR